MADSLYFSRSTKMFVKTPATFSEGGDDGVEVFEIPILEGFSVSQTDNSVDITSSEASSVPTETAGTVTKRGQIKLKTSKNPAEFSFQTYVRPYATANDHGTNRDQLAGSQACDTDDSAIELILWALMAQATNFDDDGSFKNNVTQTSGASGNNFVGTPTAVVVQPAQAGTTIDFTKARLGSMQEGVDIVFQLEESDAATFTKYTLSDAVINEATVDFDIEGIATISWSGMAKSLAVTQDQSTETATVFEGIVANTPSGGPLASFIQNKVSSVVIDPATSALNSGTAYNVVLTGGSITISNNITFITPDTMGKIDAPFKNIAGNLSITGNLTCYVEGGSNDSQQLFTDLLASSNQIEDVELDISVGSTSGPCIQFNLDHCHLDIPTTNFEDVVTLDIPFTALGDNSNLLNPVAAQIKYIAG